MWSFAKNLIITRYQGNRFICPNRQYVKIGVDPHTNKKKTIKKQHTNKQFLETRLLKKTRFKQKAIRKAAHYRASAEIFQNLILCLALQT